jgi:hypothetical protein
VDAGEVPQRGGQRRPVGDLAVGEHSRGQLHARDRRQAAVTDLRRGEEAAVDVQPDGVATV